VRALLELLDAASPIVGAAGSGGDEVRGLSIGRVLEQLTNALVPRGLCRTEAAGG
jgi:hypothetical protein